MNELSDEEWREFQNIPDQGYSHRAWVNARIKERVELAVRLAEEAVRAEEREVITEIVDLVAPQYRRTPLEDLPEFTADAYRRGRNGMLDAIREILIRHGINYPPKDPPPR